MSLVPFTVTETLAVYRRLSLLVFFQSDTMTSFTVTFSDGPTIISSYVIESDKTADEVKAGLIEDAYYNHITDLYDEWDFTVVAA